MNKHSEGNSLIDLLIYEHNGQVALQWLSEAGRNFINGLVGCMVTATQDRLLLDTQTCERVFDAMDSQGLKTLTTG